MSVYKCVLFNITRVIVELLNCGDAEEDGQVVLLHILPCNLKFLSKETTTSEKNARYQQQIKMQFPFIFEKEPRIG